MTLEHVAIWTDRLEELKTFYQTYFNGVPNDKYTNTTTQFQSYFLTFKSGARLKLMSKLDVPANQNDTIHQQHLGIIHLAFGVDTMAVVDQKAKELAAAGYPILRGPRQTGDGYYEFEINSFGTIYEVLFFWKDAFEKKDYHLRPEFNTNAKGVKPFNGVAYKHPRGRRIAFWNWDMPGLRSAVHIDGTINNNNDKDKGWTVELAIPWTSLKILAEGDGRALPPKTGDTWRMDFSRFNVKKGSINDSGGWAWSSHGVWDSHVPECFTYIEFSE